MRQYNTRIPLSSERGRQKVYIKQVGYVNDTTLFKVVRTGKMQGCNFEDY